MTWVCDAVGLGQFGDRRLQKGGLSCKLRWSRGQDRASVGWREAIGGLVAGRDVLAIQDSSELAFGGEAARARGFGPVGRGGGIGGLLLHAVLAVDASTGALLGPVDVTVRSRTGGKVRPRRRRQTADKEPQAGLDGSFTR